MEPEKPEKPENIRITLNNQNKVTTVEIKLPGKGWVEAEKGDSCDPSDRDNDAVISVGKVAEPQSCYNDPRCTRRSGKCSMYIGGNCYYFTC